MIAKTSMTPCSNSLKHTVLKLTTKEIFPASKQCQCCINSSSLNSTGGTLNKISHIDKEQEESDKFSANSKSCKHSKCTKKIPLEKSSIFSKSKLSSNAKNSNLKTIRPIMSNSESTIYKDTVVTRSMRKRKRRWVDDEQSNWPLSNTKSHWRSLDEIKTIENIEESNCVGKVLKTDNIESNDAEIIEINQPTF